MRKKKNKHDDLSLELIDEQDINSPSPDYGMMYKGTDMYWYPETTKDNKKKDTLEDILMLKD